MKTTDNLDYAMRECAHLLKHEEHRRGVYTRFDDGLDIPPSTYIEVIVRLVHEPDKQVTPILEMEEAIA